MTSKIIHIVLKHYPMTKKVVKCTGPDRGLCKKCNFRFRCFTDRVLNVDKSEAKELYRNGRCKPIPDRIHYRLPAPSYTEEV